jgi:hypothetical protein
MPDDDEKTYIIVNTAEFKRTLNYVFHMKYGLPLEEEIPDEYVVIDPETNQIVKRL